MENTEWVKGLFGDTRVFNNKYQLRKHDGSIELFDTEEDLEDYLQEYFFYMCERSKSE